MTVMPANSCGQSGRISAAASPARRIPDGARVVRMGNENEDKHHANGHSGDDCIYSRACRARGMR